LFADIDAAIEEMLPEIQGAVFAYTQSDEISILLSDFATPQTSAWFDGNLQKVGSVASSIMTAEFNKFRYARYIWDKTDDGRWTVTKGENDKWNFIDECPQAYFDARVFTIPDRIEVMNYFIWRNNDCTRNSVSMVAQSMFSHKQLQGKTTKDMLEMIREAGKDWATNYTEGQKYGRIISREEYTIPYNPLMPDVNVIKDNIDGAVVKRSKWSASPAWKFTDNKDKLLAMIPEYSYEAVNKVA